MTTVNELIKQLQQHDPNEPIVYQYLLQEHTDLSAEDFEAASDYLADSDAFAFDTSVMLSEQIMTALSDLEQEAA